MLLVLSMLNVNDSQTLIGENVTHVAGLSHCRVQIPDISDINQ